MNPYRHLVGSRVRVDHTAGSSTGILWSSIPKTVWLLAAEGDVFIPVANIVTCEAAT